MALYLDSSGLTSQQQSYSAEKFKPLDSFSEGEVLVELKLVHSVASMDGDRQV